MVADVIADGPEGDAAGSALACGRSDAAGLSRVGLPPGMVTERKYGARFRAEWTESVEIVEDTGTPTAASHWERSSWRH